MNLMSHAVVGQDMAKSLKSSLFFISLLLLSMSSLEARKEKQQRRDCCTTTLITQKMVNEGLKITKPGVYEFCSNIVFSPGTGAASKREQAKIDTQKLATDIKQYIAKHGARLSDICSFVQSQIGRKQSKALDPQVTAITIASNDVYINMRNFKLEQGDASSGVVGFDIAPGVNNVTIANGTVQQFTGAAISSFIEQSTPQLVTSNLSFINLNLLNNCPTGIADANTKLATGLNLDCYADTGSNAQPDTFVYSSVVVENCRINHNGITGFVANNIDTLKIQNTQVNDTFSEGPGFTFGIIGLGLANSRNISVIKSSFNNTNNGVSQPFTVLTVGILQSSNRNAHFSDCELNSTTHVGHLDDGALFGGVFACGSLGAQQENYLWENCQFNGTRTVHCQLNNGFHCSDLAPSLGSSGNKFVNCQFNGIQNDGVTEFVAGLMYLDIDSLVVEDCQFSKYRNNYGGPAPDSYPEGKTFGIYYQAHSADAASIDVENMECVRFKGNTITDFQGDGAIAGIMFLDITGPEFQSDVNPQFTNVVLENNVISKIFTTSTFHFAAGILSRDAFEPAPGTLPFIVRNFVVDNCKITDIGRTVEGKTANVAGIYLDSVTNPVITNNTIIATTNGILFTNQPVTGLPVTNNGLVQQNKVTNCSAAGYVDTSAETTSAWLQNVSYLNGVPYAINPLPGIQTGYAGSNTWFNITLP